MGYEWKTGVSAWVVDQAIRDIYEPYFLFRTNSLGIGVTDEINQHSMSGMRDFIGGKRQVVAIFDPATPDQVNARARFDIQDTEAAQAAAVFPGIRIDMSEYGFGQARDESEARYYDPLERTWVTAPLDDLANMAKRVLAMFEPDRTHVQYFGQQRDMWRREQASMSMLLTNVLRDEPVAFEVIANTLRRVRGVEQKKEYRENRPSNRDLYLRLHRLFTTHTTNEIHGLRHLNEHTFETYLAGA